MHFPHTAHSGLDSSHAFQVNYHVRLGYLFFSSLLYPMMWSVNSIWNCQKFSPSSSTSLTGAKRFKKPAKSRISCICLSASLWLPPSASYLPPLAALDASPFTLLCVWMVYALLCSQFKCKVMKCFMFFFSRNVYLPTASYFSIPVMLRALEVQKFSTTGLHEIRRWIWVFGSPSSSSLCHKRNLKTSKSL